MLVCVGFFLGNCGVGVRLCGFKFYFCLFIVWLVFLVENGNDNYIYLGLWGGLSELYLESSVIEVLNECKLRSFVEERYS